MQEFLGSRRNCSTRLEEEEEEEEEEMGRKKRLKRRSFALLSRGS